MLTIHYSFFVSSCLRQVPANHEFSRRTGAIELRPSMRFSELTAGLEVAVPQQCTDAYKTVFGVYRYYECALYGTKCMLHLSLTVFLSLFLRPVHFPFAVRSYKIAARPT